MNEKRALIFRLLRNSSATQGVTVTPEGLVTDGKGQELMQLENVTDLINK